jgi:hypothetical protein
MLRTRTGAGDSSERRLRVGSFMRKFGRARRLAPVAAIVIGLLAIAGASSIASANSGGPGTAIQYGSTWAYASGEVPEGWMNPGFDASEWATDAGPFSNTTPVYCAGSYGDAGLPTTGNSDFPIGGSLYLRNSFALPADAWGLHLSGTIDNYAAMWVNGNSLGSANGGNCSTGDINVDVPNASLQRGATSNLVAVNASDDGSTATYFALQATYGAIAFGNQPVETQKNTPLTDGSGPIYVTIAPPAGGAPVPDGTEVDLTLQTISGTGTLSGGTAFTSGGVATFPSLAVSDAGQYRLVATSGGATVTSNAFVVANQITPCTGSCSAQGSSGNTSFSASSSSNGGSLAVSVAGGSSAPPGVCGANFTQAGASGDVSLLGGSTGNLRVTWKLDKSLVGNRTALSYNLCVGAENLLDPNGSHTTGWKTKDGSPAVPVADPNLGVTQYWGLLRDCLLVPWAHGLPTSPCWIAKYKNLRSDVIIDAFLPYPWDAGFHGG